MPKVAHCKLLNQYANQASGKAARDCERFYSSSLVVRQPVGDPAWLDPSWRAPLRRMLPRVLHVDIVVFEEVIERPDSALIELRHMGQQPARLDLFWICHVRKLHQMLNPRHHNVSD